MVVVVVVMVVVFCLQCMRRLRHDKNWPVDPILDAFNRPWSASRRKSDRSVIVVRQQLLPNISDCGLGTSRSCIRRTVVEWMHTAASLAGRRGRRRRRGGRDRGGGRSDQWSSRSHLGAGIDAGAVALDTATSSFIPSRPNCFVVVVFSGWIV